MFAGTAQIFIRAKDARWFVDTNGTKCTGDAMSKEWDNRTKVGKNFLSMVRQSHQLGDPVTKRLLSVWRREPGAAALQY